MNRREQAKKLKKRGLELWSEIVRARDGCCIMCGKTQYLNAHHWLFRKAHSVRLSLDTDNGATLCYSCHIGRIHRDGDGYFALQLAEKMQARVGKEKYEQMIALGAHPTPLSLEEIEEMVAALRLTLDSFKNNL